jgi:hypothetical protein
MEFQLREYDVKPGELSAFIEEWRAKIVPLRKQFGFKVIGAWSSQKDNKFVWVLGWDGPSGSFKEADAKYAESPARKSVDPNPARHLAHIRELIMAPVL